MRKKGFGTADERRYTPMKAGSAVGKVTRISSDIMRPARVPNALSAFIGVYRRFQSLWPTAAVISPDAARPVLNGTLIGAGIVIVLLSILPGPLEHLEAPAPAPVSAALDAGEAGRG